MLEFIVVFLLILCFIFAKKAVEKEISSRIQEDRANRYFFAIQELEKWCRHDLPELEVICKHLIAEGEGLAMNAGTPAGNEACKASSQDALPCTISGLREQIRRMKNARQTERS